MNDGHLVVGYHGCDITTRDKLVSARDALKSSKNRYDWLGPGFYFFEGDMERAFAFASASKDNPEKRFTAQPIATPAVVGCLLNIQRCLDMTTRSGLNLFEAALSALVTGLAETGAPVPANKKANEQDDDVLLRRLDNAVFTFIHENSEAGDSGIRYQAVRGAFRQGLALAPNSGFHRDSHIQIALRDPTCIVGWFLPPGQQLLAADDFAEAEQRLVGVKAAYKKPRKKAE